MPKLEKDKQVCEIKIYAGKDGRALVSFAIIEGVKRESIAQVLMDFAEKIKTGDLKEYQAW